MPKRYLRWQAGLVGGVAPDDVIAGASLRLC